MRRFRFRIRGLLIAVAILAVALGGWTMYRRRALCLARIELLELRERVQWLQHQRYRDYLEGRLAVPRSDFSIRFWEQQATIHRRNAEHTRFLASSYRRVARYPWLPLPREPEWPDG